MDFIIGLPTIDGKDAILVVVDRLTKYSYFCGIQSNYKGNQVIEIFAKEIQRLHGVPNLIVVRDIIINMISK